MAKMNHSTNGGNVGTMKKNARRNFIPDLARRVKDGPVEITLRPKGITPNEFEREALRAGMGWTKYKGNTDDTPRYKLVNLN